MTTTDKNENVNTRACGFTSGNVIEWYLDGAARRRDLQAFAEIEKGVWPDRITIYHPVAAGQIGPQMGGPGKLPDAEDLTGCIVMQRAPDRKPKQDIHFGEEQEGAVYVYCGERMQIQLHVYEEG